MVISVSGSNCRPHNGEYESAIAFFKRGRPLVGEYWLQSTLSSASFAAFRMNCGGLYPKKPCPILTIGCFGDAAAPSLTMLLDGLVSGLFPGTAQPTCTTFAAGHSRGS